MSGNNKIESKEKREGEPRVNHILDGIPPPQLSIRGVLIILVAPPRSLSSTAALSESEMGNPSLHFRQISMIYYSSIVFV